jgi:multidrug efflux pump subunit AcrB
LDGTNETLVPNFLAMLCILAVFVSAFFMQGAARNLFIPLALAVGFAMIASYILSTTLVPVLLVWVLQHRAQHLASTGPTSFDRFRNRYRNFAARVVARRWTVVSVYLVIAVGIIFVIGGNLGREIFPAVDAGQFALRLRAAPGTRIEETERIANRTLDIIAREADPGNVEITLGFVGVQNPAYPVNTIHLWTSGPEEAVLQIQLKGGAGIRVGEFQERLRKVLPQELPDVRLSFESNDIVSRVMSFGAPTPIEVAVSGPDFAKSRQYAEQIKDALGSIPSLRDLAYEQELDYPAVKVQIDRQLAGMLGITAQQIGHSLTEATSSSRFTVPNFWPDPRSGVGYQVQVQLPTRRMDSLEEVKNIPVGRSANGQIDLRNVADVTTGTVLGEYDRYNMQRMLVLGANIGTEQLGEVAHRVSQAIEKLGPPPQGVNVNLRGQVVPMGEMFSGLQLGLFVAILVIFLLLAANFQSFLLSFASCSRFRP